MNGLMADQVAEPRRWATMTCERIECVFLRGKDQQSDSVRYSA